MDLVYDTILWREEMFAGDIEKGGGWATWETEKFGTIQSQKQTTFRHCSNSFILDDFCEAALRWHRTGRCIRRRLVIVHITC